MLAWTDRTTEHWCALIDQNPEMLALPCDIYGVRTVGELLWHVVAVETRYALRLARRPELGYDAFEYDTAAKILAAHQAATALIREQLAADGDWDEKMEFQTLTMGRVKASRKTMLFHALLHSIRHYAQLATLARHHGFPATFVMDFIAMGMERV
jgi:uncharacterized damage-inducible protein DinB